MTALGITDVDAYRERLESDDAEWRELDSLCRVTITRFFRDRAAFEELRAHVFPELASVTKGEVRCWSVPSASGEEPYSMALAWAHREGSSRDASLRVLASEIDPVLLERARRARYPAGALAEVPREWLASDFTEIEGELEIDPRLRSMVTFEARDVRGALPEGPFHLIACRNLVLTYFAPDVRDRVLAELLDRIAVDGALMIGAHEEIPGASG
jgi:chemotaxis protein methyltransferase CheR